ncbi:MAG: TrkH family potassium uptake protein [Methanomassiliicoccus sp.]|nr:TrkH family potassium uptake protein [Methanomassiliicoccus sp.]
MSNSGVWRRTWKSFRFILRKHGITRYTVRARLARRENTIAYLLGMLFSYLAIALILPLIVALIYNEDPRPWIYPIILCASLGAPLLLRFEAAQFTRPTAALFVVTMGWLIAMVLGAIPYIMYGMSIIDAMFETMSGFTTTGSTIMLDIEAWPNSILFWRSFSQWLGGAGIILIFITILPMVGVAGRNLAKSEFSGFDIQNISLRIQEESSKFHYIYMAFSGIMFLLLLVTGIGLFDSLTVMFSTISTGGFSPHTQSIAYYHNPLVEWIVIVFMFLAATNFYLHFQAFVSRDRKTYWRSAEFRSYAFIFLAASVAVTAILWGHEFDELEPGIRTSMFQVISCMSSTGFATTDFSLWSRSAIFLLLALIVIGGCSGSTAGGIKVVRFVLSRKFIYSSIYKTVHPRAIFSIKLDGRQLGENVVSSMMAVAMCYLATALLCSVVLVLLGIDPTTAISAAVTTLSNAGPGVGQLGPMGTFGLLPDLAKLVLIFTMWVGRLEFITVFAVLTPIFWREMIRYRKAK